jgi:four helix bundle protein
MPVKQYQDLIAWQKGITLVTAVYEITQSFPREEVYGLTSQLRRAAVSIPSNIAEGQGRATSGEFIQFLCHARGSLFEVETQIEVARQLDYLTIEQRDLIIAKISELGRILNGLITSLQDRKRRVTDHQPQATSH